MNEYKIFQEHDSFLFRTLYLGLSLPAFPLNYQRFHIRSAAQRLPYTTTQETSNENYEKLSNPK